MSQDQDKKKELKPEWRIFCENYVIKWNGTQSYMVAYPDSSEKSAGVNACRLLGTDRIQEYIEEIQKDLAKLCGVSAARNINELKKIAYTNIANFKDGWMKEKDFDELTDDEKAALSEIQYTEKTIGFGRTEKIVKFKLHDKQRAIEIMNKMLGFNQPEKHSIAIDDKTISTEEREKRIAALEKRVKEDK